MLNSLKSGLIQAALLGFIGVLTGTVAGWISFILANGAEAVATVSADGYFALAILLPAVLAFWSWVSVDDEDRSNYAGMGRSLVTLLVASIAGTIAASVVYLVTAVQIPSIWGGEARVPLQVALLAKVGWSRFLIVLVINTVVGIGLAIWAYRQVSRRTSN